MSFVRIWEKINHIITALNCINSVINFWKRKYFIWQISISPVSLENIRVSIIILPCHTIHTTPINLKIRVPPQYKDHLYRYEDSHHKDKMVMRPCYLYNRNLYTDEMKSLYWYSPQVIYQHPFLKCAAVTGTRWQGTRVNVPVMVRLTVTVDTWQYILLGRGHKDMWTTTL